MKKKYLDFIVVKLKAHGAAYPVIAFSKLRNIF
jgi:hypothetical protein